MSPLVRLRLFLSLVGIIIWASGAMADRRGEPWGAMAMSVGLAIMVASVIMRFLTPKRLPEGDERDRSGSP